MRKRWPSILVAVCGATVTLLLWRALIAQERAHFRNTIKVEAKFVSNKIVTETQSRIFALFRLAKRWEIRGLPPEGQWESDAVLFVSRFQGYQAIEWVAPSFHVRRIAPLEGNEADQDRDLGAEPRPRVALEAARDRREVMLARSIDWTRGGEVLLVCIPLYHEEKFLGFLVGVFRFQQWLDTVLENVALGYRLALVDGQEEVYGRHGTHESVNPQWGQQTEIAFHGVNWRLQVWPRPESLTGARSPLPNAVLVSGLLVVFLLAWAVRLAQMARLRAKEVDAANRELKTEIWERQRAEEALRSSEADYRSLVQNAPYGIFRVSAEGNHFSTVNPALLEMLGYGSQAELLAANLAADIYRDPSEAGRWVEQYRNQKRFDGIEVEWKRKDETPIVVRLGGRPVTDARGAPQGFEVIAEDITQRRVLEHQLQQALKMEAIGRLAGGLAHDFNNLVMIIQGYTRLLLNTLGPNAAIGGNLEEIRTAAERAASLTRQLLAFSRKQVLQPQVVDLNALVTEAVMLLSPLLGEHIKIVTRLDRGLGPVKADPGQIVQVTVNLAVNARDAMPHGGELTIETANVQLDEAYAQHHAALRPGSYVMLTVSDTGSGMDPETLAHIFEPFYTTKERGKGTGLGLATVYGIVGQSGGAIRVDTALGQGTSFKIYLPQVREAVQTIELEKDLADSLQGSETVLVVEDEESLLKLTREFLKMRGYTVLEARNGAEAIQVAEQHPGSIHVLLTDAVMPGMSGRELAERLAPLRPDMKVMYMSAYTEDAIVHLGILDGETAFLEKPFNPDDLARKVREVLNSEKYF